MNKLSNKKYFKSEITEFKEVNYKVCYRKTAADQNKKKYLRIERIIKIASYNNTIAWLQITDWNQQK